MATSKPQDRGIFPRYSKLWLLEQFGQDGFDKIKDKVSAQTKKMLDKPVPHDWYPAELSRELYEAIEEEFSSRYPNAMFDLGSFIAKRSMAGFLKYLVRMASVEQVINRLERIWLRYHDSGSARGDIIGKEDERFYGILSIKDYNAGPKWCKLMDGYIKTFLTQTGVRRVKAEKKECIHKGDDICSWIISWEE